MHKLIVDVNHKQVQNFFNHLDCHLIAISDLLFSDFDWNSSKTHTRYKKHPLNVPGIKLVYHFMLGSK